MGITSEKGDMLLDASQAVGGEKTFLSDKLIAPDITSTDDFIIKVPFGKQIVEQQAEGGHSWQHNNTPWAARAGITAPTPTEVPNSGGLYMPAFNGQATRNSLFTINTFGMNHNYVEGTDIPFYIVWSGEDNTSGNVKWFWKWWYASLGSGLKVGGEGSIIVANPGLDGSGDPIISSPLLFTATASGKNFAINTQIMAEVWRVPDDAQDTYDGKLAFFYGGNNHDRVSSIGSRQEVIR